MGAKVGPSFWVSGLLALLTSTGVAAQVPGRIISGFPPGGAVDILARLFAEEFARDLGRPFVVETKSGAGGQIAAELVKAAAPDGNTLMIMPDSNMTVYPHTTRKATYDSLVDFVPVAHLGGYDLGFAIALATPAADFAGFVNWAKGAKDPVSYGSPAAGSVPHFYGLMIGQAIGVPLNHVPYRGSGPAINDVVAGHLASTVQPIGTLLAQARGGKLKLIATSGAKRSAGSPATPTFGELGYPMLETGGWFGLYAPAATPRDVVVRLNDIVLRAGRTAAMRERMVALDLNIEEFAPEPLAAKLKADHARWGAIVKRSGFTADSN